MTAVPYTQAVNLFANGLFHRTDRVASKLTAPLLEILAY